jgi:YHS domain-containing protein
MDEREYAFCGPGCMKSFAKTPHQYRAKVDSWVAAQKH